MFVKIILNDFLGFAEKVEKMWDKNANKDIFIVSGELYCNQKGNVEKLCEARGGINFPHYKMISTINKALEKIYGKIGSPIHFLCSEERRTKWIALI